MALNNSKKSRSTPAAIATVAEPEAPKPAPQKTERTASPTARVEELEKELARAVREKEELARDVEALCMQSGSSIFDGSMVLSERVFQAEKELGKTRDQLAAAASERDGLREDVRGHKEGRRVVEESWRGERARAERLERELQFYQAQSGQAMADRDKAAWEAEELKRSSLALEARAREAEGAAAAAAGELAAAEAALAEARARVAGLEVKARESETIPGLWKHIAEKSARIESMETAAEVLERNLSLARSEQHEAREAVQRQAARAAAAAKDLAQARAEREAEAGALSAELQGLTARAAELEAAAAAREARLDEAEASLAAAQAEVGTRVGELQQQLQEQAGAHAEELAGAAATHAAQADALTEEVEGLRARLKSVTAEFEQARGDKLQALQRAAQAEATAEQAFQETGRLLEAVNDLKDRAAQATQEKVAALLQVASLREAQRGGGDRAAASAGQPASSTSPQQQQPGRLAAWRIGLPQWVTGGGAAEEAAAGGSEPQDLRQAIDQLRALHERLAQLDSLAAAAAEIRAKCAELHAALTDSPTHVQRRELGARVGELRPRLTGLEVEHWQLLPPPEPAKAGGSPEAGRGGRARRGGGSEGAAAAELVASLKLAVDSLEALSARLL